MTLLRFDLNIYLNINFFYETSIVEFIYVQRTNVYFLKSMKWDEFEKKNLSRFSSIIQNECFNYEMSIKDFYPIDSVGKNKKTVHWKLQYFTGNKIDDSNPIFK